MQDFQQRFIELAVNTQALSFGEFTLKSGRQSPYFFNAGRFNRGSHLAALGYCYAAKIAQENADVDLIFGPAYKGIPLAAVTAAALATHFDRDVRYAFNRKEAKQHGEGGNIVGAELRGNIVIVDDVITAGTAIREVISLLQHHQEATISGVVVGLDRQEQVTQKGPDPLKNISAIAALATEFTISVGSIITLEHLIEYLSNDKTDTNSGNSATLIHAMHDYRTKYGC